MCAQFFWIIGGGLLQIPLIAEVKKLGLKTIVTDGSNQCFARSQADLFFPIDIFDIDAHLNLADQLIAQDKLIVGVLAAGIDAPETMARLAQHLKLPGVSPEIARLVKNKNLFRDKLAKLGYPTPRYQTVSEKDLSHIAEIVDRIRFPLIVKNTDNSGSRGTRIFLAADVAGVIDAVKLACRSSRSSLALIEEFWEGPEQTVETLFDIEGRFHRCFITDRLFNKSQGFALETGLRHPSMLPQATQDEMYTIAHNVARDLGIRIGAAKYDMILTPDGPRIIEMTVRLSGGYDCQYLVPAATGKNILKAAVLTAMGQPFSASLLKDSRNRVALSDSIWPTPGRLVRLQGLEAAQEIAGLEHLSFRYNVGDVIEPYVDCTKRVCFIIVSGANETDARNTLEKVKSTIQIETEKNTY